jgi:tetratricopeptide (TPR) repeat protein
MLANAMRTGAATTMLLLLGALAGVGCDRPSDPESPATPVANGGPVEATSLLDRPLYAPLLTDAFRAEQEALLDRARADIRARPDDPDPLIWAGRRNAYLGRYRAAILIYTKGVERYPEDARFLRHRGHRYITTRRLDAAVRDLERAADMIRGRPDRVEPDGLPNERGIPTSTLNSNIWYHLGLARYLSGDFEGAREAYRECTQHARNADMLSATSHWRYMTLRRMGREDEARAVLEPIHDGMEIIENHDYHRLLLMYRGEREPEALLARAADDSGEVGFASTAYGIGNWYLYHGDEDRAMEIFERVVETDAWAAFGTIAAEAELARRRR